MLYFKNVDLADTYHVSLRTVLNWIEAAKQGKLDLALHNKDEKTYIANTAKNTATIERIVSERKKFRNTRGHKLVAPKPEFYELYNDEQIVDIISSLANYRELPHKYNYFNGGAEYWDAYSERLAHENSPNFLTCTQMLLDINRSYIDSLIANCSTVNVIDIGVGNGMPVKGLLEHLLSQNRLARYIGLDISSDMLRIAERNLKEWFGDRLAFEGHRLDINYDRFNNLLIQDYVDGNEGVGNLILLLGGTLENFRSPDGTLRVIHDSMGRSDLFLRTGKLDTEATRQYFDFGIGAKIQPLSPQEKLMVDLLGIDEDFYDVEMGYDDQRRERYIRLRLKVALTVSFTLGGKKRSISLNKDDAVLLWRYWHYSGPDMLRQLRRSGFSTLHASETQDEQYLLTVSRIKSDW